MTAKEIQKNEIGDFDSSHFISYGMAEAVETNLIIGATIVILLFGIFSNHILKDYAPVERVEGSWACTAELRVCPDGSTVSRTPPYCQFAACPR